MPTLIRHRQPATTNVFPHANNRRYMIGGKKFALPAFAAFTPGPELSIEPVAGKGSATFSRASVAAHRDHENVVRQVPAGEARFQGARRVRNLCTDSNDITQFGGPYHYQANHTATHHSDETGEYDEHEFTGTDNGYIYAALLAAGGETTKTKSQYYTVSCEIKLGTKVGPLGYRILSGSDDAEQAISGLSTTKWTRVCLTVLSTSAFANGVDIGFDNRSSVVSGCNTGPGTFYVRNMQVEHVSGQSNQVAGNFIRTTGSALTKYFPNTNENTVSAGVMTERSGEPLHPVNTRFGPRRFARFKKWQASTAYAVGDKIIPATGSGPAGGNGYYYECVKAGTSDSSEPTWETGSPQVTPNNEFTEGSTDWTVTGEDSTHICTFEKGACRYESDTTSPVLQVSQAGALVIGKAYRITTVVREHISGGLKTDAFGASIDLVTSGAGVGSVKFGVASSGTFHFYRSTTDVDMTLDACGAEIVTADNGCYWIRRGLYTLGGYLAEPARTNRCTQSYDLTTTWGQTGTGVSALDQDGFEGIPNTATTLTDDNAAAYEYVHLDTTIANDSNWHVSQAFIEKDAVTSRFVGVLFQLLNGTSQYQRVHLNTQTGELTSAAVVGTAEYWVEDWGDTWRVCIAVQNNTTGNTLARHEIEPAHATVAGTPNVAATGSCIVWHTQVEHDTKIPTSPIVTSGATATRSADDLSYTLENHQDHGVTLASMGFVSRDASDTAQQHVFGARSGGPGQFYKPGASQMGAYDGVNLAVASSSIDSVKENPHLSKYAVRYNKPQLKMQVIGNEVTGAEQTYDGAFEETGGDITVLRMSTVAYSAAMISDILMFNGDLGEPILEDLTNYDQ